MVSLYNLILESNLLLTIEILFQFHFFIMNSFQYSPIYHNWCQVNKSKIIVTTSFITDSSSMKSVFNQLKNRSTTYRTELYFLYDLISGDLLFFLNGILVWWYFSFSGIFELIWYRIPCLHMDWYNFFSYLVFIQIIWKSIP